ncbi:hypothetical protein [Marinobacter sp.]|uniref:hypothetical protein n=1 Tax=Marinobacter sp. TaxID=50741 RepID=UPI0035698EEB
MLRLVGVFVFFVAIAALIVFGPSYFGNHVESEASYPECDLLAGPCTWTTSEGEWTVSLEPGQDEPLGQLYHLEVSSPSAPDRFLAVLRGQSMYMGEYPIPLRPQASSVYAAEFTAPLCSTGTEMVWRVDLQSGQKKLGSMPLTLVFRAQK